MCSSVMLQELLTADEVSQIAAQSILCAAVTYYKLWCFETAHVRV